MRKFLLICLVMFSTVFARTYMSSEAKFHIGEEVTICGNVKSTYYATKSYGEPTFLNLDRAYPNQTFTVVIFGKNRDKFNSPDIYYDNKNICVSGYIEEYKNTPQIIIKSKNQIKVH